MMTAGCLNGQQKGADRFKNRGRAFGGSLNSYFVLAEIQDKLKGSPTTTTQQPTTRTVHAHPHTPHTHAPYVCDNGGIWNHSLQRCDCPTGFSGNTRFFRNVQKWKY